MCSSSFCSWVNGITFCPDLDLSQYFFPSFLSRSKSLIRSSLFHLLKNIQFSPFPLHLHWCFHDLRDDCPSDGLLKGLFDSSPYISHVNWKKKAQRESCELSFIWGKMRTIARETAIQIALRNCSKEVGVRKVSIYVILVKEEYMQSFSRSFLLVTWRLLLVMKSSR